MTYDNAVNEGVNINIGVSQDVGATWTWKQLSNTRWDDRPWVEVAPDGTAHVIWNDGDGVSHAVSTDRGKTWSERPKIHPQGGSSHLAIGPKGEVAVRITPLSASGFTHHPEADLIAVSLDASRTWTTHRAPGERTWTFPMSNKIPLPRWVEPIAWDAKGALYSLWTQPDGVHLARSQDSGKSWQQWLVVESKDATPFFPYVIARGDGELAATWFTAKMPGFASLRAMSQGFRCALPAGRRTSGRRGIRDRRDSRKRSNDGGRVLPAIFLRDGRLAVVTPIQNRPAKRLGVSFWTIAD